MGYIVLNVLAIHLKLVSLLLLFSVIISALRFPKILISGLAAISKWNFLNFWPTYKKITINISSTMTCPKSLLWLDIVRFLYKKLFFYWLLCLSWLLCFNSLIGSFFMTKLLVDGKWGIAQLTLPSPIIMGWRVRSWDGTYSQHSLHLIVKNNGFRKYKLWCVWDSNY